MEHISKNLFRSVFNGRRPLWDSVKELGGIFFILSLVLMAGVEESFPLVFSYLQLPLVVYTCFCDPIKIPFLGAKALL